jgi:hypothetical protein
MEIIKHSNIVELHSNKVLVNHASDALDILGNVYYQGFDKVIIHEKNITKDFFDLKNCMAGEILQKFSNYRVKLAIVGDFSQYTSKSIRDFIYESNKTGHILFVTTVEEAIDKLK